MNEYNERAVVCIDEAGSIIANKNITIDILTDKLAAANQLIKQLREVLKIVDGNSNYPITKEALALPTDTSALDQIKASYEAQIQVLREALKVAGKNCVDDFIAAGALQLADKPQDTSALEGIVAKAGEVMRERCCASIKFHTCTKQALRDVEEIRAIPAIGLDELHK